MSEALQGFLNDTQVSVLRSEDRQIPIILRGAPGSDDSFGDLANIAIATPRGLVPLDQIARFEPHLDFSTIRRGDQTRMLTVTAISSELSALDLVAQRRVRRAIRWRPTHRPAARSTAWTRGAP